MKGRGLEKGTEKHRWGILGVAFGAIAASICCLGPFVLVALGMSGAWAGNLAALEPFRPFFIAITLGLLGLAFYRVYRKPREICTPGSACERPAVRKGTRITLWVVAFLAMALMASPYVLPRLHAEKKMEATMQGDSVTLAVENMTCDMCALTIRKSLMKLEGVEEAKVTFKPPLAKVTYDPSLLKAGEILKAISDIGYRAKLVESKRSEVSKSQR